MQRQDALNTTLGASNTGRAAHTETHEMKVFIENQNNYMGVVPDENMFATKLYAGQASVGLCVRLGHVHGPHDQDQHGQHKDSQEAVEMVPQDNVAEKGKMLRGKRLKSRKPLT